MNKKIWFGTILIAILLGLVEVGATPSVSATYSLSDTTPKAGSTLFYYVTVTNLGTSEVEDVEVTLVNRGSAISGMRIPGRIRLGDIDPGSSETASFAVPLGDTEAGVKRLRTEITYNFAGDEKTIEYDQFFTVESTQLYVMRTSSTDDPLRPGEIGKLVIEIANNEVEPAKNFKFDFTSGVSGATTVFKTLGGNTQFVSDDLGEGEVLELEYDLYVDESITSGVYYSTLTAEYIAGGIEKTETLQIGVRVQGDIDLDIGSVQTDPMEVKEGDEDVKVTINVQNIGQEQVKNLKITFEPSKPFALTTTTRATQTLGVLGAAGSASSNFYIDVSEGAASGRYEIAVALEYQDTRGNSYEETENITLGVKSTPVVRLKEIRFSPTELKQGQVATMFLLLQNVGSEDAEGVSVRALESVDQPFTYEEKSDRAGILKAGQEGEAAIKFTVEGDATPKKYGIELEIRYTDGQDVYTKEEVVLVEVSAGQGSDPTFFVVVVLLVAVIVFLGWKIKRKYRG